MIVNAFISICAGLGLFFIGVKGIGANMGQMAGRSLRRWVARSTGQPVLAAAVGLAAGALTQSTNAVTVILISLAKADLITAVEAAPILAWSNVGTSVLVMLAAVDIHLFVLGLIALAGLCFYFNLDRSPRWRPIVSTLFALGMLFLGLEMMRGGSHDVHALGWATEMLAASTRYTVTALLAGAAFAMLVQSSATVAVMAIAMTAAGLLTPTQAALVIFGASVGSGIATYFIGFRISGLPRQLAAYQAFFKIVGVMLLLPLFLFEQTSGLPFLMHWSGGIGVDTGHQVAAVYVACQIAAVVAQILFTRPLKPVLDRLMPPSVEENLAKPRYLYEQAVDEPESALGLVDKEQARLFALTPLYLGIADQLPPAERGLQRAAVIGVATALAGAIAAFLDDLADSAASRDLLERAADRRGCNALLRSIHESLDEAGEELARPFEAEAMRSLAQNIGEGLGALLLTADEAVRSRSPDDLVLLRRLTADRESLVDALRRRVMAADRGLSAADQAHLYALTSLLERVVWLLRRYGGLVAAQVERETEQTEAVPLAAAVADASAAIPPASASQCAVPGRGVDFAQ